MIRGVYCDITRITLLALVLIGLALRLAVAMFAAARPGWANWQSIDPELYASRAAMFVESGRWEWTFRGVDFVDTTITGFIKAPLYQIFLSAFTYLPMYPAAAPIGHAALGALTILAVFSLASQLHSARAGLIAAALYATWFTAIAAVPGFWQEHLYNLLVTTAAALLVRACADVGPARDGALGGAVLGAAALTRSMPLWLMPFAVAWLPRRRWIAAAAFAAVVVPYVVWLSMSIGRFVPIENIGGAFLLFNDPPGVSIAAGRDLRDFSGAPLIPLRQFAANPAYYVRAAGSRVRDTLTIASHQWLEDVPILPDASAAALTKSIAVASDAVVAAVILLAPFGAAAARNRRGAGLVVTWIVLAIAITAVAGHRGLRSRWAVDPLLCALASIAAARTWRQVPRPALAAATAASLVLAAAVVTAVPRLVRAHAHYGITPWVDRHSPSDAWVPDGRAGFVVQTAEHEFTLDIRCPADGLPRVVRISVDGRPVDTIDPVSCAGGTRRTFSSGTDRRAYVQIDAQPAGRLRLISTFESP